MIVVNIKGGPKKIVYENETDRESFIDLERQGDEANAKRYLIGPKERKVIHVKASAGCKYVTSITPAGVRMIAVEEEVG